MKILPSIILPSPCLSILASPSLQFPVFSLFYSSIPSCSFASTSTLLNSLPNPFDMEICIQGGYIEQSDSDFWCTICERWFKSGHAILAHCRNTFRHEWCERCTRAFVDEAALDQHIEDSPAHKICDWCSDNCSDGDFSTLSQLETRRQQDHFYCASCGFFLSFPSLLDQHTSSSHYTCMRCSRTCMTDNELRHVSTLDTSSPNKRR